jgi:hypothetical protein
LVRVAERLGAQPGASIPVACGGWAETQAAYRLLANEAVDWEGVLAPHWDCSVERMRYHPVVLCAYSTGNWTRIPSQTGRGFHGKLDTDSMGNWTPEVTKRRAG